MQIKEYIKRNIIWIIGGIALVVAIIAAIVFIKSAINTAKLVQTKSDTIRKLEYVKQPPVKIPEYIPYAVHDTIEKIVKVPIEYQPSSNPDDNREKLISLSNKYFKDNVNKDTIHLKDSTGKEVGQVKITDKISENTNKGRQVEYELSFPKETVTITKNFTEAPRRKVLLGMEASYTTIKPLNSAGIGLMYQDRKNRIYKVSVGQMFNTNQQYYSIGLFAPISLRK